MSGYYIAIEGIDGSGKSTLTAMLGKMLRDAFPRREVFLTAEPGKSSLGRELRQIALGQGDCGNDCRTLAFALDRALNIRENIKPALDRGAIVLSDRCFLSSLAYQGNDSIATLAGIRLLCQMSTNGVIPNKIFYIDTSPQIALERLKQTNKPADYFEGKGLEFFVRTREAYQKEVVTIPEAIFVSDTGTLEEMSEYLFLSISRQLATQPSI
jgi:dTMP kinase